MDLEQYEKLNPTVVFKSQEGKRIVFNTPSRSVLWRMQTLKTKEPYTLFWLDCFKPGEVMLDVGANVGLYTLYASIIKDMRVYAFEPESQNYALLNKNIETNQLSGRVTAFPCAMSDRVGLDRLYLSTFQAGGSCHSLGEEVGFDLKPRPSPYAQGCVSWTVDRAVADGAIQVPRYIKIDVDGFEHKVIAGARETLARPEVKELLIEVNPHLAEHRSMVDELSALGFSHDPIQTIQAARRDGPFKGVGEWIFKRYQPEERRLRFPHQPFGEASRMGEHGDAWSHVLQRIQDAPIETEPFAHAVVDNVFPADYYARIGEMFPRDEEMLPLSETGRIIGDGYKERMCVLFDQASFGRLEEPRRPFWEELARQLMSPRLIRGVIEKFHPHIAHRLEAWSRGGETSVWGDALVVSDRTRYSIGPHTDAPHRLLTFLFYLPRDASLEAYGTSVYKPLAPDFECPGIRHYGFEGFQKVKTVGFLPNRLFVFAKNSRSFHGVEPILRENLDRRLIIYNVRIPSISL